MGGKNSKREEPCGSTPPRGSPSTKVYRSRSLPIKVFNRKLGNDYGGSVEGKPLHEDADDIDQIEEYRRLVELENLHGRDKTGLYGFSKQYITRSCINSLRSSREEIIYEEEEDTESGASGSEQHSKVESYKASPAFPSGLGRSRLSSQSAPCLAEYLDEVEGFVAASITPEGELLDAGVVADVSFLGENFEKYTFEVTEDTNATSQEVLPGSATDCGAELVEEISATECVGTSLNVGSVSDLTSKLPCNKDEPHVREGHASLDGNYVATEEDDRVKLAGTDGFYSTNSFNGAASGIVLREPYGYVFQAVKYPEKHKTWKRLKRSALKKKRDSCGRGYPVCEVKEGMTGNGKMNLLVNNPGKRQQDARKSNFTDSGDMTWSSSTGKRIKDGLEGEEISPSDAQPDAFAWGLMGQSDPFLGFDAAGFFGKVPAGDQISGDYIGRSPGKISKGTALARKVRGLRASPKPVSSLESCLRAQMADALDIKRIKSVIRPLNFSSSAEEGKSDNASVTDCNAALLSSNANTADESSSKSRQSTVSSGLPSLPNLSKFLKEYAVKLATSSKRESRSDIDNYSVRVSANDLASTSLSDGVNKTTLLPVLLKKRKVSDSRRIHSNGFEGELDRSSTEGSPVSFETLLFSFGLGLGVLLGAGPQKLEVEKLSQLLEETQMNLEALKSEFSRRKSPVHTNKNEALRESEYESIQQDHMAELEAELEAELDQLTGGESATMDSQYSVLDELDMDGVASVLYGDLAPAGLPAGLEEDSDGDPSGPAQPACLNNYAVSPRELTRLLRKLQTARQDELITELEEDLEESQSKLRLMEKELEMWKDKVRRLTEASFAPGSGDECATPSTPNLSIVPVGLISTPNEEITEVSSGRKSGKDCIHSPLQENGTSVGGNATEKDLAGPRSHIEPVLQGELKTRLNRESAKQELKNLGEVSLHGNGLAACGEDVSNEFLRSMIEFEEEGPSQAEVAARDCRPILDNAQIITQLIDSVHGLNSYGGRAESVDMGSATPSVGHFSSSVSISDTWDHPIETSTKDSLFPRAKLLVPYPSRRTSYNSDLGNYAFIASLHKGESTSPADPCSSDVRYAEAMESSKSVSDMSEIETADYRPSETHPVRYINSAVRPVSESEVPPDENPSTWVGVSRAGLTTPVDKVKQLFKTPQSAPVQWPGELSPTVLEKIARWEGLMEGETPGPALGADWECQSRASEPEHQCAENSEYDDVNIFSEDNLILEAEEMFGRMLIKRIVEKSKHGSDSLVKKAQTALATLERDDGVEADIYYEEDTYMNERTDSEAGTSEKASELKDPWSGDQEKQQTNFLDDAVREEYEFFRRLEIINKDRKAKKVVKEKTANEMTNAGGVDFSMIPELDLGLNSQLSPGSQPSGVAEIPSKVEEESTREKLVKQVAEPNIGGRDIWLSRGDSRQYTHDRGSSDRRDEVRSRRRL